METKNISQKDTEIEKLLKKGYEEIEAKRWDYAIIVFEKVLSIELFNNDALSGILKTHYAHANDELQNENWDAAISVANQILSINSSLEHPFSIKSFEFPYLIRILAYNKRKDLDEQILCDIFFAYKFPENLSKTELKEDYLKL